MRLLYILIPIVLLFSCSISEEEQIYIEEISKLEQVLDSAAGHYFAIDTAQLFKAYERINQNLNQYNELDAIVDGNVITYAALQKTFKRFIGEHTLIIDEISYSKNQLHAFKKDIKNNKLSVDQIERYYDEEREAVGVLIHKLSFNAQNINHQLASFSQLNDSVEIIIKRIESSKK